MFVKQGQPVAVTARFKALVYGVSWDYEFESVVSVLYCQVEVSASG